MPTNANRHFFEHLSCAAESPVADQPLISVRCLQLCFHPILAFTDILRAIGFQKRIFHPSYFSLLLIPLLLMTIPISPLRTSTRQISSQSRLLILPHNTLNTPDVMLRLPHIIQLRPSCSLLFPLHNLYPFHIRAVNFKPHLHPYARQMIAE